MDDNTFQVVIRNSFYRSTFILGRKAKEYAPGQDRLSNFKKAAALQGISPEQALFGMMAKHLVSVAEMTAAIEVEPCSEAVWEEKLTDSINYLFLLEALVRDRYEWESKNKEKGK
jgi:hypothetical protein